MHAILSPYKATLSPAVYTAWRKCARHKRASSHAQRFEINLLDNLCDLSDLLHTAQWQPAPPVSFILQQNKPREIHAADFTDRVVHHYLVPPLAELYERVFIHDVFSNRKGKGTHTAVKRLNLFMRQLNQRTLKAGTQQAGQSAVLTRYHAGHFLQLDIKSFFTSIDKPILFTLLQKRLAKAVRGQKISIDSARHLRDLCHIVLRQDNAAQANNVSPPWMLRRVPSHKKLANAGHNKGVAIGNLTSQFFANVYLNELDQFIKHKLKCQYYLRYVDDFVLLHHSPQQLAQWRNAIAQFLAQRLALQLRDQGKIAPVSNGVDFLGYIVRPNYTLVRQRVVNNCVQKLQYWQNKHITGSVNKGWRLDCAPAEFALLQTTLASYQGHFQHAKHIRLLAFLCTNRFPWLALLFDLQVQTARASADDQSAEAAAFLRPAIAPMPAQAHSFKSQQRWFARRFMNAKLSIQKGYKVDLWAASLTKNTCQVNSLHARVTHIKVVEHGYQRGGLKKRVLSQLRLSANTALIRQSTH